MMDAVTENSSSFMRRRRRLLAILGLIVLAVGIVRYYTWNSPRLLWRGKPSAYWIGRLSYYDLESANVSAEEFLFAAGKDVVPELIRGLSLRDNWASDRWSEIYFKLGKWQRFFDLPIKRSGFRANCARGLGLLGAAASEAEPALLKALKDKDPYVRS